MRYGWRVAITVATALAAQSLAGGAVPSGATGVQGTASIGDASVVEGNNHIRQAYFTLTLSRPATTEVDVTYNIGATGTATGGLCATPGVDLENRGSAFATVRFPVLASGMTAITKQIAVNVCADLVAEPNETFTVSLWNVNGGYTLFHNVATGLIIDDDSAVVPGASASIGDASLVEGDARTRSLKFPVTLSEPTSVPVAVTYSVRSGSGTCGAITGGVATDPYSDCWNLNGATKTLSIPAGSVERSIQAPVFSDTVYEGNETFTVQIVSVQGATVNKGQAVGTIVNDDTVCNSGQAAPAQYKKVVVFAFENRTWATLGGVGFGNGFELPYLHALAQSCSYFSSWTEADPSQASMTQYTAQMTGARQPNLVNNCAPAASCSTTADNIFRQVRAAGKSAINYVEGATGPCSAGSLAGPDTVAWVQTVPALYMWDPGDRAACSSQVRPYSEFDPNNLPDFAFITPTPCHNGHQFDTCGTNSAVNTWARANVEPVLQSQAYRRGEVAVFIWYDEDSPVPNMQIAPSATPGPFTTAGIGYGSTLKAWESMLGLPCLADACTSPDMRSVGGF